MSSRIETILTTVQASPGWTTSINVPIGDEPGNWPTMAAVDAWLASQGRRRITETERDAITAGRQADVETSLATLPDPGIMGKAAAGELPNPKGYNIGDAMLVQMLKEGKRISQASADRLRFLFPGLILDDETFIPGDGEIVFRTESSGIPILYVAAGIALLWWISKR